MPLTRSRPSVPPADEESIHREGNSRATADQRVDVFYADETCMGSYRNATAPNHTVGQFSSGISHIEFFFICIHLLYIPTGAMVIG